MRALSIIKLISAADLFTVVNALLGFAAIICVVKNKIDFAIMLILLGILADGVDGFVARRFSKKWEIGDYLDIMADTISFCVAPTVLIFALYYNGFRIFVNSATESLSDGILSWNLMSQSLVILSCLVFLASGVLRLARFCYLSESKSFTKLSNMDFNVISSTEKTSVPLEKPGAFPQHAEFTGLPAPGAALMVLLLSALRMNPVIVIISTILLSFLMISDIKYPKTRGKIGLLSGGIILITISSMFFSFHTEIILPITLIFAISYGFCSPLILKLGKNR